MSGSKWNILGFLVPFAIDTTFDGKISMKVGNYAFSSFPTEFCHTALSWIAEENCYKRLSDEMLCGSICTIRSDQSTRETLITVMVKPILTELIAIFM